MTKQRDARTVYTTGSGRVCPHCGWPAGDCRCSSQLEEAVPDRIVARLRIERAGRRGKTVTVVEGLPRNAAFLRALAADLKRACGTGGTTVDDRVELQGDHVAALRALLSSRGWLVKG